jgi:hypothetical protein
MGAVIALLLPLISLTCSRPVSAAIVHDLFKYQGFLTAELYFNTDSFTASALFWNKDHYSIVSGHNTEADYRYDSQQVAVYFAVDYYSDAPLAPFFNSQFDIGYSRPHDAFGDPIGVPFLQNFSPAQSYTLSPSWYDDFDHLVYVVYAINPGDLGDPKSETFQIYFDTVIQNVPEPSAALIIAFGVSGLIALRKRAA